MCIIKAVGIIYINVVIRMIKIRVGIKIIAKKIDKRIFKIKFFFSVQLT